MYVKKRSKRKSSLNQTSSVEGQLGVPRRQPWVPAQRSGSRWVPIVERVIRGSRRVISASRGRRDVYCMHRPPTGNRCRAGSSVGPCAGDGCRGFPPWPSSWRSAASRATSPSRWRQRRPAHKLRPLLRAHRWLQVQSPQLRHPPSEVWRGRSSDLSTPLSDGLFCPNHRRLECGSLYMHDKTEVSLNCGSFSCASRMCAGHLCGCVVHVE